MIISCERGPLTKSVISSQTKSSMQKDPATLGAKARRRGGEDARQRQATSAQVSRQSAMFRLRCVASTALKIVAFGNASSTLSGCWENSIEKTSRTNAEMKIQ